MGVRFHCDAPECAVRNRTLLIGSIGEKTTAGARVTALEVPNLRDRENPAERPVSRSATWSKRSRAS